MNDDKLAGYFLFHSRYPVRVAQMHTYTDFQINHVGLVTSLNRDYDNALADAPVTVYYTPAEIAVALQDGIEMDLVRWGTDGPAIYALIIQHFRDAGIYFDTAPFINDKSRARLLKDLRVFDTLADVLFQWVQYHLKEMPMEKGLGQFLNAIGGMSMQQSQEHRPMPRPRLEDLIHPRHLGN